MSSSYDKREWLLYNITAAAAAAAATLLSSTLSSMFYYYTSVGACLFLQSWSHRDHALDCGEANGMFE